MTNGFSRAAKKELGVSAEVICPRVTENNSQTRIIRNWYPARDGVEARGKVKADEETNCTDDAVRNLRYYDAIDWANANWPYIF